MNPFPMKETATINSAAEIDQRLFDIRQTQ